MQREVSLRKQFEIEQHCSEDYLSSHIKEQKSLFPDGSFHSWLTIEMETLHKLVSSQLDFGVASPLDDSFLSDQLTLLVIGFLSSSLSLSLQRFNLSCGLYQMSLVTLLLWHWLDFFSDRSILVQLVYLQNSYPAICRLLHLDWSLDLVRAVVHWHHSSRDCWPKNWVQSFSIQCVLFCM